MLEEVTLRVGVDAGPAKDGANEFKRSAADIIRCAGKTRRAIEDVGGSFRRLAQDADRDSKIFAQAVRNAGRSGNFEQLATGRFRGDATSGPTVKNARPESFTQSSVKTNREIEELKEMVEKATIDRLTRRRDPADQAQPAPLTHDPFDFLAGVFVHTVSTSKLEAKREREIKERSELAERFQREAEQLLTAGNRVGAEKRNNQAAQLLEVNLELKKDDLSQLFAKLERQVQEMGRIFGPAVQDNPINPNPEPRTPIFPHFRNALKTYSEQVKTLEQEITERGEQITALRNKSPEAEPSVIDRPVSASEGLSPQNAVDDDRVKQQIEDTTRSIDLLKEQKTAVEDSAAAATAQKEQELELLQREKDCLERLNKALQDNANLRQQTGDQTNNASESEAANENLAEALESSGQAAQQTQADVDALNTALAANAGINTEVVGGLNQEIDNRQQVNDTIVERLRLEEEQKQRLIQAEDETERRGKAVEASIEQIRDAAKDSFKDVIKGTESIGDAFRKLADRITDILLDLALDELLKGGTGFSDLFGTVFGGLGSMLGGGGPAFTGGSTNFISGFNTGGIFDIGSPFHQGGVVGFDGRPARYHTGGISGLRPDEVPAILQRGEEVLTRNDPRHRDNGGSGGNSSGVVVNVNFPNARNTDEARQAGSEIAAKAAAAAQRGMARKGIG